MNQQYKLLRSAEEELLISVKYYEQQASGLGSDFLDDFEKAVELVLLFPDGFGKMDSDFRRFLLKRFPFGIIYRMDGEVLVIVSVMHLSRRPESWKNNL